MSTALRQALRQALRSGPGATVRILPGVYREAVAMSEEEYLASKGYGDSARPTASFIRATKGMSGAALKRAQRGHLQTLQAFDAERDRLRAEYRNLVKAGTLAPKGRLQTLMEKARGHPERADTQAARRILAKRGLWDDQMSREVDRGFEGG